MRALFFAAVLILGGVSQTNASIVYCSLNQDQAVAINCTAAWQGSAAQLAVAGNQFGVPAKVSGAIDTDTVLDPTLLMADAVNNDTGFSWTGYEVNVYMSQTFTLANPTVTSPGDWTATITQPATWNGTQYVGSILFAAGTPIAPGGALDFGYQLSFSGSVHYTFDQEMTPVPEPTTMVLVGFGLVGLFMRRRPAR